MVPLEVTEHVLVARICPACERRRLSKEAFQGVVLDQQRLGVNLVSLTATLREEGRLPLRTIQWYLETVQWYLETVQQLHLSVGAIVQATPPCKGLPGESRCSGTGSPCGLAKAISE